MIIYTALPQRRLALKLLATLRFLTFQTQFGDHQHRLVTQNATQKANNVGSSDRCWSYNLYTLWLFNKSDLKTVILPTATFAFCCALFEITDQPCSNVPEDLIYLLARLPHVLVWTWVNLLMETIANQRLPESILEDSINKPWRPFPSKRLNEDQGRHLLLWMIPAIFLFS